MATGASKWAASNRPIFSLSRTFDHLTLSHQFDVQPSSAVNPLSTATISAVASTSGMKPIRRRFVAVHLNISAAVMTDCAISAIFLFSFMAVVRSNA